MPQKIATAVINKADAMDIFFGYERLRKTANNPNAPLQRIFTWFKEENARTFSTKNVHLGKPDDDYVMIYYFEGVRYKIDRLGNATISTADADVFKDELEHDFQVLIDTILNDEMVSCMRQIAQASGAQASGVKYNDTQDGAHTQAIMGISQ